MLRHYLHCLFRVTVPISARCVTSWQGSDPMQWPMSESHREHSVFQFRCCERSCLLLESLLIRNTTLISRQRLLASLTPSAALWFVGVEHLSASRSRRLLKTPFPSSIRDCTRCAHVRVLPVLLTATIKGPRSDEQLTRIDWGNLLRNSFPGSANYIIWIVPNFWKIIFAF